MNTNSRQVWKQLIVYLVITAVLTGIVMTLMLMSGKTIESAGILYVMGLMWSPGIAALISTAVFRLPLKELGWKIGKLKYLILSIVLPLLYALPVYLAVWVSGIAAVAPDTFSVNGLIKVAIGIVFGMITALGEEIGWRGFMVPRLVKLTGFGRGSFLSGIIWGIWHIPFVLFLGYRSSTPVWFAVACFMVTITGVSYAFAWVRMASGSLWTATLLHAAHNTFIQSMLDPAVIDNGSGWSPWVIGEFGFGLVITCVIVALIFSRIRRPWEPRAAN